MQTSNIPEKIELPFANSGTKRAIPTASQIGITPGAASLTDGFPPLTFTPLTAGGVPPSGADFNGILNLITASERWINAGGSFPYDADFSTAIGGYPKGALIPSADGTCMWLSTADDNTNDPDAAGANWAVGIELGPRYITAGGTANAITANYSPAITAIRDGMQLRIKASATNTGAVTFAPNAISAAPIVNAQHVALSGGEIASDSEVTVQWNSSIGSGSWVLLGVAQLAAPSGTSQVGHAEPGSTQAPTLFNILRPRIRVAGYLSSAMLDDVLAGTRAVDVRDAVQAAFAYACTLPRGSVIEMPGGGYYLGTGSELRAQLQLGTPGGAGPSNVDVEAFGATLYPGAAGKCFGIFQANRASVRGLKIIGYTGGTIDSTRQNDALITVNYNSSFVTLDDLYLTNCLGDCIYAGGSFGTGGETGYQTENLTIRNSVLKMRYGDGTASSSGGTMSRTCIAGIDVVGANIHDNRIYGIVDLEPNINNQHIVDVHIHDNKFKSGHVTPQSTIGTDYWYDEPTALTGGTVIPQGVYLNGVSASPIVSGNICDNNTFEYGTIFEYNVYTFDSVFNNDFQAGLIRVGSTSGTNNTTGAKVSNNKAISTLTGETTFIKLEGYLTYCTVKDNEIRQPSVWCVANNGASTGDNGRNIFTGNKNMDAGALGDLSFSPLATSFANEEFIPWTAVVSGTGTPGTQGIATNACHYTRVGRLWQTNANIILNSKDGTATGGVKITGLPFAPMNSTGAEITFTIQSQNVTLSAGSTLIGVIAAGGSEIDLFTESSAGRSPLGVAAISATSSFSFNFSMTLTR